MVEIVANLHMHTPYSDGHLYHREIAAAAARAGLDVIVVTDHNVLVGGKEGYLNGVLLLVGEEVHDVRRRPQVNHCLIYGAQGEVAPLATNPRRLIQEVVQRGGLAFLAHLIEYGSSLDGDLAAIPWTDWDVRDYTGIELWNYMTEFKARLRSRPAALFGVLFPSLVIRGPFKATLRKWDELMADGRRVVAIGNADAHGTPVRIGPLRKVIFPYEYLFRCVNTHLLIERPLTQDVAQDKRMIYDALQAGRCFIAYDLAGRAHGFTFTARSSAAQATMGSELHRHGATRFEVQCPAPGWITLIHNGRPVARRLGRQLEYTSVAPGVYRVEVQRLFRGRWRGWIYSNPIYVR
ncbi:MAG: CehA/McbA family metallohydrolase [Thermoflexales bacterium]|nr:CehA/McbA family metallohydrolase [Thermoflexales bacterium]